MKTGRLAFVCFLALLGLMLLACGGGEEATATPRPGSSPTARPAPTATPRPAPTPTPELAGKLRVAISTFGNELYEPRQANQPAQNIMGQLVFDQLLWVNSAGEPAPGIALQWEMAPDGLSWTYKLRTGHRFHNGDPVTADDVKSSLERFTQPGSLSAGARLWITSLNNIEIVAPDTAKAVLKVPWPLMPVASTVRAGAESVILPKNTFDRVGEKAFFDNPVGSGPWKVTKIERGTRYTYEAVSGHPFRSRPGFRELEVALVPEETTRIALIRTGAADIADIGADAAIDLKKSGSLQVFDIPVVLTGALIMWGVPDARIKGKPTEKREVRQALSLAINRQEILDTILGGIGSLAAHYIVAQTTLGYDPSWKPDPYEPDRARQLLTQAGFGSGFPIRLYAYPLPGGAWFPRAAEAVAGYWSRLNVRTEFLQTDAGTVSGYFRARPQDERLIGNVSTLHAVVQADPTGFLTATYTSNALTLVMNNAQMDTLMGLLGKELDPNKRVDIIRQIAVLSNQEYVTVPLATTPALYAVGGGVGGWKPVTSGSLAIALETVTAKR